MKRHLRFVPDFPYPELAQEEDDDPMPPNVGGIGAVGVALLELDALFDDLELEPEAADESTAARVVEATVDDLVVEHAPPLEIIEPPDDSASLAGSAVDVPPLPPPPVSTTDLPAYLSADDLRKGTSEASSS